MWAGAPQFYPDHQGTNTIRCPTATTYRVSTGFVIP
jgi:hypothetical protein